MPKTPLPAAGEAMPPADPINIIVNPRDRLVLATTIEALINMLDSLEPDPDLEPVMGWGNDINGTANQERLFWTDDQSPDECEAENEHGGDVLDEPHDELDQGDREPWLGWGETSCQRMVGLENWIADGDETSGDYGLRFTGDGVAEARRLLNPHSTARHANLRLPGADWWRTRP